MLNIHIAERNHWLTMVALSFLLGCLCASHLMPGAWTWLLAILSLVAALLLRKLGGKAWMAVALCFWTLGVCRAHIAADVVQPEPGEYQITATVRGSETPRSTGRISFVLTDISLNDVPVLGNAYATLQTYDEPLPELFDGARIRMNGYVYHPGGKNGDPHFDFRTWTLQNHLSFGISGYEGLTIENAVHTAPVIDPWHRIREGLSRSLERVMGEEARVASALLFGDRSGMSEDEDQAFRELGIAHVMSVSGLHVSILGSILVFLMDRLRMPPKSQWPVLALFLATYCAVTGFSAAAIRAAVMLLTYSLCRICLRYPDHLTVLMGSMLIVLAINPLYAYNAGFVLSYSAMLGITLFAPSVREALLRLQPTPNPHKPFKQRKYLRRIHTTLVGMLTIAITAQLGVLLPTMAYFQQLPTYGILINMFIVPLVSYVLMPLYTAVLPLSFVPGIGEMAGALASLLTKLLLWLVSLLSCLPYAALRVPSPSHTMCVSLGGALILLARRMPGAFRKRAVCALMIAAITFGGAWLQRPPQTRYIQLAAGQADSALILDGDKTILIDAGENGNAALNYLMDECRDIDALFITHLHMDHIGGVEQLLDSPVRIHQVYLPRNAEEQQADRHARTLLHLLREKGIPVTELATDDELRYNKTSVRVLWPNKAHERTGHDANEMSLVLLIDLDGYRILSTSDLSGIYENYAAVPADVLKVAHHGSNESTFPAFLDFVDPDYAIITSSDSHSLPHPETLERLKELTVLCTNETGDILLTVEDGTLTITPYKTR